MSRVSNYKEELDKAIETCIDKIPSSEAALVKCKEECFDENTEEKNVKSILYKKILNECKAEITQIWKSSEKGTDLNTAATLDYIVSGYSMLDESEKSLLA